MLNIKMDSSYHCCLHRKKQQISNLGYAAPNVTGVKYKMISKRFFYFHIVDFIGYGEGGVASGIKCCKLCSVNLL